MDESRLARLPGRPRFLRLLPFGEARDRVGLWFRAVSSEWVGADRSAGRVSSSTVRARCDIPGSNISAMDGYAIVSADTEGASPRGPCQLRLVRRPDGKPRAGNLRRGEASAVLTGDPLPRGSDAVLRLEQARVEGESVIVPAPVPRWKNVSLEAEDVKAGDVLLRSGEVIMPASMAVVISAGIARVRVHRAPRVGVISVGRRLKRFGDASPGRTVNNYANLVLGYLSEFGGGGTMVGIARDGVSEISGIVADAARRFDMVVTIGGVSVGSNDLVPDAVMGSPGSRMVFHGLRAVPLRPVGLASIGGVPVVMLPGHAVSAAISFFAIGVPVLNVLSGLRPDSRVPRLRATAAEEFANRRPMDAFVLAVLESRQDGLAATPLGWGSNLQSNLARANGFVHLRRGSRVRAGEPVSVELFGSSQLLRVAGGHP